jgi:hypothetical protein
MKYKSSLNSIWGLLTTLLILGVLALTLWANSNNLNPRFLFIDEQITFYPVIKILNPSGLDEWLWLISDGGDYRYGRLLWNAIALFAVIPAKLLGEAGQIIASREAGVACLLLSYLLLTYTFIQKPAIRFIALLTLISLPYSSYYMSMPKPEPIMLLCAALFLYFYKRNDLSLGRPYWIFLGMAFGAKISFLLPLLALLGASLIIQINSKKMLTISSEFCSTIIYLMLGFSISNPFFIPAFIAIGFTLLAVLLFSKLTVIPFAKVLMMVIAGAIFLLFFTPIREYALGNLLDITGLRHALGEWTRATFLKINDGGPSSSQNFASWFAYLCAVLSPSAPIAGGMYLIGVTLYMTSQFRWLTNIRPNQAELPVMGSILFIIGAALLLSPMLSVKNRLWGMYFLPGLIFFQLGFFSVLDSRLSLSNQIKKRSDALYLGMLGLVSINTIAIWLPHLIADLIFLATKNINIYQSPLPPHLIGI